MRIGGGTGGKEGAFRVSHSFPLLLGMDSLLAAGSRRSRVHLVWLPRFLGSLTASYFALPLVEV